MRISSVQRFRYLPLLAVALATFAVPADATPLDDKIAAYKQADEQTEAAVGQLLRLGLQDGRSAEVLAVVRPWLAANPATTSDLQFYAGRALHYSGNWEDAVTLYRKFLQNKVIDPERAAIVVPALYRLLLNELNDSNSAYALMRDSGKQLRQYVNGNQFDAWFLTVAHQRNDVVAMAQHLAAIYTDPSQDPAGWRIHQDRLFQALQTFRFSGPAVTSAMEKLLATAKNSPDLRARWDWIKAVTNYNRAASKLTKSRQPIPAELITPSIEAAEAFAAADPFDASWWIANGWMQFSDRHSPLVWEHVDVHRAAKARPLITALSKLSPEQLKQRLNSTVRAPAGQTRSIYAFLTPKELRGLAAGIPSAFNSFDSPKAPMWDASITLDEAKKIAPHLARNQHPQASLIRAYAASGQKSVNAMVPMIMASEVWRFNSPKAAIDTLWNSGVDRTDADHAALVRQHAKQAPRVEEINQKVAKTAGSEQRRDALVEMRKELMTTPTMPGIMSKWDHLFINAPLADRLALLTTLSNEVAGDREYLLRRAAGHCGVVWQPKTLDRQMKKSRSHLQHHGAQFIAHLSTILEQQAKAGELNETIFGMWLQQVNCTQPEMQKLMHTITRLPAYEAIAPAYRNVATDQDHFGRHGRSVAMIRASAGWNDHQLHNLPKDADAAKAAAALTTALKRVDATTTRQTHVYYLKPLAALPTLTGEAHSKALSLFTENSPIGYPRGQGYGELAERFTKEFRAKRQWGKIEPYASSFWRAAEADADERHNYPRIETLVSFAEAALAHNAPSAAFAMANTGMRGGFRSLDPNDPHRNRKKRFERLRAVAGKASVAMGMVEIPVAESDPNYGIYKSSAAFVQGNLDSAWELYIANAGRLFAPPAPNTRPLLRRLPLSYGFWLVDQNVQKGRYKDAEAIVKELTIWSRQDAGAFGLEREGLLKLAYADLAFRKGALPTARAWYRQVADSKAFHGSSIQVRAALATVTIDRVSRNFDSALAELERLMRMNDSAIRTRARYARAEILMDQENYKDAASELEAVLRSDPNHADALILRGKAHYQMRKLVDASEIELGVTREEEVMVPGETLKISLHDPTLSISGVGADIEVEVVSKSGDRERVLLHQLGDNRGKFRADIVTALAPPVQGDKILQVLGVDEIRFGYSARFRAKMKDLPADPKIPITIASDAQLSFSAGAFPTRKGERKIDMDELGLSTAQKKLGMRAVRPGNPVYVRVTDPDQSKTAGIDELPVSLESSSGDVIRRLLLRETGPYSGEFEAVVPTAGVPPQARASESAPGRDANMSISAKDYPGWLGNVGDKNRPRTFTIDLNDNAALAKMTIAFAAADKLTHLVVQTSMDGRKWVTRRRFPCKQAPWDGRPHVASFPTHGWGGMVISGLKSRSLPGDWAEKMELSSVRPRITYAAHTVTGLSAKLPIAQGQRGGDPVLLRYRAVFYQPELAKRQFKLTGYPPAKGSATVFLIDGQPAGRNSKDPMLIDRQLAPGLHTLEIWRTERASHLSSHKPILLCDAPGKEELIRCPDSMFNPATFPPGVRHSIPTPATITPTATALDVVFGARTQARLIRLSIHGFQGVAPAIKKITLTGRDGETYLPVKEDFMALRDNNQLEVLPGDQITVRYHDPVTATPKKDRHESRLQVAYNTATLSASFLNYELRGQERHLRLEPIRRFNLDDAVAIVIDDVDMDTSAKADVVEFRAVTSAGTEAVLQAVETDKHSGRFIGRVFPVSGKPERDAELQVPEGGTLKLIYRDVENLDPGIPVDRSVTIEHAKYGTPAMGVYNVRSELLQQAPATNDTAPASESKGRRTTGPESVRARRTLSYNYLDEAALSDTALKAVVGSTLRFDVVVPHLALAASSEITAYVQTDAGRKMALERKGNRPLATPFDVTVPGTLKLVAVPSRGERGALPKGYSPGPGVGPPNTLSALDEGRFAFSVPLILGDRPRRSFATNSAKRSVANAPDGLVVQAGDVVHIGYAFKDKNGKAQWRTATVEVGAHAFLDVMNGSYNKALKQLFVGERVFVRVMAPGLDRSPDRDWTSVKLKGTSGANATFKLRETEAHSGVFKGVFTITYPDSEIPAELPTVELKGLPAKYGDDVIVTYDAAGETSPQVAVVKVNKGGDGTVRPFSKRFTGDEMAVKTSFTLAECFFELAKKHRKMEQQSLARREMGHAQKLLSEAIATFRDDELRAHAEYLLGNLSQEYADLSQNGATKLPMYQDALARFSKIPVDYPETKFANKAQFKTALVYEKMGENEIAVEEYVKLAYKYPDSDHIPEVMSRLGRYFQKSGQAYKEQADALREKADETSRVEVLRLDELSYPEFIKAALIYAKMAARFPEHELAGHAGLASAQNYMRAHQYSRAVKGFTQVANNRDFDDRDIRSQALYWCGLSHERMAATLDPRSRGGAIQSAYKTYRRTTFDFPDSKWAKYARGRLNDPVFGQIIAAETKSRADMLQALESNRKRRGGR